MIKLAARVEQEGAARVTGEQRQQRRKTISALRRHLPWARVGGAWALVGLAGFGLALGWMLLHRPGLLRGAPLRRAATDLTVAALIPVTLAAVALALAYGGWPLNVLASCGLLTLDSVAFTASTAARGWVGVLDGWRAGVMVRRVEPWEGSPRFEVGHYWAFPPRRGHGRRLRRDGTRLADRFGVVLEMEAINQQLARGTYRRAGFTIVAGSEQEHRPTMRRVPRRPDPARSGGGDHARS